MIFSDKIRILIILFSVILSSCATSRSIHQGDVNRKFESIYGAQVKEILKNKNIQQSDFKPDPQVRNFNLNSEFKKYNSPSQIFNIDSPINERSEFETHKLFLKKPQMFLPNMITFKEGKKKVLSNKIPADVFEIKYNTTQHPPFQISGINFDLIHIPEKDAYGVLSTLEEKIYPLPPRNIVAKNVQQALSSRTDEDIEFSQELISENELIRKQIQVNKLYFAENNRNQLNDYEKSFNYDNSSEEWVTEKKDLEKDDLSKLIRNQVIIKNLRSGIRSSKAPLNNRNQPQQNNNQR